MTMPDISFVSSRRGIGSGSPISAIFQPILNDRIGQTLTARLDHALVDNKEQQSAHAMDIELPILVLQIALSSSTMTETILSSPHPPLIDLLLA